MMTIQFIVVGGEKVAVIPIADYERLVEAAEDRADGEAAASAEERRVAGEEYLPAQMVDRLLAGDPPLRVWRKHRNMTLQKLGEKANLSTAYLSQLENGVRDGGAKVWRRVADALRVDVDDILPRQFE